MTLIVYADNLPRVMGCNGSLQMGVPFPPEVSDTPDARAEGTAAHHMAASVFNGLMNLDEMVDRKAPSGAYMDHVMADHVARYLEDLDRSGAMEVEANYAGDGWEVHGRADYIWWNADDLIYDQTTGEILSEPGTLFVRDLKYGHNIVEPFENWTLLSHAIGFCIKNMIAPKRIVLTIDQPRQWHPEGRVRHWVLTYNELLEYYKRIADTLYKPADTLQTGPHCYKCRAMSVCPAYRMSSAKAHDATSRVFIDNMPNEALEAEMDLISASEYTLKNRKAALTELIMHRLKSGEPFANYTRMQGYGHRKWNEGLDGDMLLVLTGKDLRDTAPLVTPAEAERRGVPEAVVNTLSAPPKTGMKLVRESADKRAKRLLKANPSPS